MRCRGPADGGDGRCERDAAPHRELCWGHLDQSKYKAELEPLRRYVKTDGDPKASIHEAILRYADAETDHERRLAFRQVIDGAVAYVKKFGLKWTSFKRGIRTLVA